MLKLLPILLSVGVLASTPQLQTQELPTTELLKQNQTIVALASEEISKTLPQSIDAYTVLEEVEGSGTTLIYHFAIDTGAKSDEAVRQEDRRRMEEAVTMGVCRSAKRFLDAQIKLIYRYKSAKSRARLFEFVITQAKCHQ